MMERRSRSTTRYQTHHNGTELSLTNGLTNGSVPHYTKPHRHSGRFKELPPSVALRPGGDSRTLSPDRRNGRNNDLAYKSSSYNQYTMQPPPPRLGLVPPPRPPPVSSSSSSSARPQTTSTPQSTPVKYEDFAEGLNQSLKNHYRSPSSSSPNHYRQNHSQRHSPSKSSTKTVKLSKKS